MRSYSFQKYKVSWYLCLAVAFLAAAATHAMAANLVTSANSLSFISTLGSSPSAQVFAVSSTQVGTSFSPTVTASTTTGGNWLNASVAAGSNSASANLTVQVNSQNLPAGSYSGQLTISAAGVASVNVGVQLQV